MPGAFCVLGEKMRNLMKKYLRLLCLCLVVLFCLAGCAGEEGSSAATLAEKTAKVLLKNADPADSDWVAFGLARWGEEAGEAWIAEYHSAAETRAAACKGVFHERKHTENAKVILGLAATGKNPTDVSGYNLLTPLADFEQTIFQGVNGAVYALLAVDSGNYEIPENIAGSTQATRQMYVDYIVDAQLADGGWALSGDNGEADLTAMALQALAKYQYQGAVKVATDKALICLSHLQDFDGGYTSGGLSNSESVAQVIVALCELGIDLNDSRFVKNGNTLLDKLLSYQRTDGSAFRCIRLCNGSINRAHRRKHRCYIYSRICLSFRYKGR